MFIVRRLALMLLCAAALAAVAGRAEAQGLSGTISYSGALGPVGARKPLCLCLYRDAALTNQVGCLIYRITPINYQVTRLARANYYAVAFLDLHVNERLDPDEPYEIYLARADVPADPIAAADNPTDIDFSFGDENLPPPPATATPTATVEPTGTPTSTPPAGAGDCDGDGTVAVAELVRAVGIALGAIDRAACPAADLNGDGQVRIEELIAALNAALS